MVHRTALEEAGRRWPPADTTDPHDQARREGFLAGAEWQAAHTEDGATVHDLFDEASERIRMLRAKAWEEGCGRAYRSVAHEWPAVMPPLDGLLADNPYRDGSKPSISITDEMVERAARALARQCDVKPVRDDPRVHVRHEPGDLLGYDEETDVQWNFTATARLMLEAAMGAQR